MSAVHLVHGVFKDRPFFFCCWASLGTSLYLVNKLTYYSTHLIFVHLNNIYRKGYLTKMTFEVSRNTGVALDGPHLNVSTNV